MSYTVRERNESLHRTHYRGNFASYGEAETYARKRAGQALRHMTFEIWRGTMRTPIEQAGSASFRGQR